MDFGKSGWLRALLTAEVAADLTEPAERVGRALAAELPPRGRARVYVKHVLRETALLYGSPAARPPRGAEAPAEVTPSLPLIRTLVRTGLDVAALVGAPPGPRREQLLALLAALCDLAPEAEDLVAKLVSAGEGAITQRVWSRVEERLGARARSLSGDPADGIALHNGAVYADANVFLRHAIALFSTGTLSAAEVHRRNRVAAQQKALLVKVLTALAGAERPPSPRERRAILRQIEHLQLPRPLEGELRADVKRAFEHPPALSEVVKDVRSAELRRFILDQTLLASLIDGRRSPTELRFLQSLAQALDVSPEVLAQHEAGVADFYARNRTAVDGLTVSAGALEQLQSSVEENFARLMQEVRETGELSLLLARAARGQTLSAEERRRMREQLIDLAKAIPALAIFAAPGGLLLLVALAKVLPFSLLPSAFQDASGRGAELARRDHQGAAASGGRRTRR